ncbi:hypothetical protein Tco_1542462, partial [Tanacetum coccineum]
MPPEDKVFLAEEQPLPAVVSPTADSLGYIIDSDPEENEEDPEEDPVDNPADGVNDDDESSDDDEDDDDVEEDEDEDEEEEEEEEEEHPTPADSVPPPVYQIDRLLAIPSPPPSPLSPLLSPLPQIPSPPLPVSSPLLVSPPPLLASPTYPSGYRAAMIRLRAESPSTSHLLPLPSPIILPHIRASMAMMRAAAPFTYILASRSEAPPSGTPPLLPIPLPIPSPPLLLPSTDCRAGVSEITLPPWKRLCIALGPRYEVGESSSTPTARPTGGFRVDYGFVGTFDDEIRRDPERYVGYGIIDTWDKMVEDMHGTPAVTDVAELSQQMSDFITTVRQDTYEIYVRLDDTQMHRMTEREARLSREAWEWSMDASDIACSKVRALRTIVLAQQTEIAALRAANRARLAQLVETLRMMSTLQTHV